MITTTIDYFDTPFTALEDDYASFGIPVDVRQPTGGGTFSVKAQIDAVGNTTSAVSTFTNATYSSSVLFDDAGAAISGRVANLVGYWAGGAPGHHGFSHKGRVAYHWRCYIRPAGARKWWNPAATPTWRLAFGGNGYVRIEKVVSGSVSVLFKGDVTEAHFLENGLRTTDLITDMTAGDYLDIYYVQDEKFTWGGYVFKAISGTEVTDVVIREAPVVGCGLFDTGTQPTKQTLKHYANLEVSRLVNRGANAQFTVAMANMQNFDAVGWEWVKDDDDDPGNLKMYNASLTTGTVDVYRKRLIRIKGGFIDTRGTSEIYTMFTGFIDDFGTIQGGFAPVTCVGFDQNILDQHIKNYPDRISYMTYNYKRRKGTSEPVYDVGSYDNWVMEYAIRDLMVRAGIDESVLQQPLKVILSDNSTDTVTFGSEVYKKLRVRSVAGTALKLQRAVHYGNTGKAFDKRKPADDEYLYRIDNTKKIWDAIQEFTNKFGYGIWFDEFGHCCIKPLNNPHYVIDLPATSGSTQQTNADAYGATYQQWVGGTPIVVQAVKAARIDLVIPRFASAGHWNFTVANSGGTVSSGTINPALPSGSSDEFFYKHRLTSDGSNSTIATLYSGDYDDYTVTLTGTGGGTTRRLDAFMLWYADPLTPRYAALFSTAINAVSVDAQGTVDEMRNYVTVVGRRKAVITDSEKLDTNPNNPEQEFVVKTAGDPYSVLDPTSKNFVGGPVESLIYDDKITDDDYALYIATSFIHRYRRPKAKAQIVHSIIPILQLYEPLYGVEQTFETITAESTLWVQGFVHSFTDRQATTRIETSSYVPLPSFEPREEIDIDGLFGGNPVIDVSLAYRSLDDTAKSNVPVTAAVLSPDYTDIVTVPVSVVGGSPPYLDMTGNAWPPIPGTVQLYPPGEQVTTHGELNTTYFTPSGTQYDPSPIFDLSPVYDPVSIPGYVPFNGHIVVPPIANLIRVNTVHIQVMRETSNFTKSVSSTPLAQPTTFDAVGQFYYELNTTTNSIIIHRLNGPTAQVNESSNQYRFSVTITWFGDQGNVSEKNAITNSPYHHFLNVDYRTATPRVYLPWKHGDGTAGYNRAGTTAYNVVYRKFYPQAFSSDPYSGSCPFYDPYTSELGYLVSVQWDCLVTGLYRISVRSVVDDTVVAWLTEPGADAEEEESHWSYFTTGSDRQVFWDGVDNVGQWNQRQSHLWSIAAQGVFENNEDAVIGKGFYVWNQEEDGDGKLGPLAFISDQRNSSTNQPIFGQGTFGTWYVRFEIQADQLGEVPRVVNSTSLDPVFNTGTSIAGKVSAVVFTHLPEPTTAEFLEISDFKTGFVFDPDDIAAFDSDTYWQTLPTADAIMSNTKPVRFRYAAKPRPGTLWDTNDNWKKASFKLTEVVHAQVSIFDQFILFDGVNYPGTLVPKRTVVTRRLMNNDHSVMFVGSDYITHEDLKASNGADGYEFIFIPEDFEVDFGNGIEESIQFNEYLQLEEVPGWSETRQPTTKRSRFQIGFMNYLFYLSAFAEDRSGRKTWLFNRKFVDRSKIIKNAYADWWNESSPTTPATSDTYRTPWLDDPHYQHRRTVVVRQWQDEGTWRADQRSAYGFSVDSIGDKLLRHKWKDHDPANTTLNGSTWPTLDDDQYSRWHAAVDVALKLPTQYIRSRQLGTNSSTRLNSWTWETLPKWVPCIYRDFHPYHLLPPMVDQPHIGNLSLGSLPDFNFFSRKYEDFDYHDYNQYLSGEYRNYNNDKDSENYNTGSDVAASETWVSHIYDMTETYVAIQQGKVRFFPGRTVDGSLEKLKEQMSPDGAHTNVLDYMRQDEIMHYEDFRGMFSRGPRPAEQPIKVVPVGPYYVNPYSYIGVTIQHNVRINDGNIISGSPGYPKVRILYNANRTGIGGWFDMKFRSEYYWESAWLFPCNDRGKEELYATNYTKTRHVLRPSTRFDGGAWTGWKDDTTTSGTSDPEYKIKFEYVPITQSLRISNQTAEIIGGPDFLDVKGANAFDTGFMPVGIGPKIIDPAGQTITRDMIFSMVLVNERRETSI